MQRRDYLRAIGVAAGLLAGCTTSEDGDGDAGTPTPGTPTDPPTPTASPTPSPTPTSTFQGPTEEDRAEVDIQYRDYLDHEVARLKEDAVRFEYREMFRNIEEHQGTAVFFEATIEQVLDGEDYFVLRMSVAHDLDQSAVGTWVGDRFLEGDRVVCWGELLGTESYEGGLGSTQTVPALALADLELLDGTPTP